MDPLLLRLALALAIGLVVGTERGWRERDQAAGERVAGVRTFALTGLFGGVAAALAQALASPWLVVAFLAALIGPFAWFSRRESDISGNVSVTSVVSAALVFALGALAVVGDLRAAAAGGVVTAGLLAAREPLHRTLERLTWKELRSALLLLGMTAVVLPILPDRPLDPFGAVNPRDIWLLAVLTGALSYAGYLAMRIAGPERGPVIAGLVGGLISSTAVTVAFARRSRKGEAAGALASGALWAAAVSVLRASFLAALLHPPLLLHLAPGTGAAALAMGGAALLTGRQAATAGLTPALGDPFELKTVLGFGLLLAVVAFLSAWAARSFDDAGLYGVALVSGIADVDAIALSTSRLARQGLGLPIAATAILLALASNTVQKAAYAWAFGDRAFAARLSVGAAAGLAAGAAGLLLARLAF